MCWCIHSPPHADLTYGPRQMSSWSPPLHRLPFFFFFPLPPASPPPPEAGAPAAGAAGSAVPTAKASSSTAAAAGSAFAAIPDMPRPSDPSICTRRPTSAALQVLYLRHTPLREQNVLRISFARGGFASGMGVSASEPGFDLRALRALEEEVMWYLVVMRVCGRGSRYGF